MIATPNFTPVEFKERKYYTIHSSANNAFTLKIKDPAKHAMVGFQTPSDALLIGNMIETYYMQNMKWPDLQDVGEIVLPTGTLRELVNVFMKEWEFEDLKFECTRNVMDMVSIKKISKNNDTYSFSGDLYTFTAPVEFYMKRFEELL
jgi:hypothetical protein